MYKKYFFAVISISLIFIIFNSNEGSNNTKLNIEELDKDLNFIQKANPNLLIENTKSEISELNLNKKTNYNSQNKKFSPEDLFSQIENKDYKNLLNFHHANLECSSIKGYDLKEEYLAEYDQYTSLDPKLAEQIYDQCKKIKIKPFNELKELYYSLVEEGNREAELMLAITHPPGFSDRVRWLSRASSWEESTSLPLIAEAIHFSSIDNYYKLFWSYIIKEKQLPTPTNNDSQIISLETSMTEAARSQLYHMAENWLNAKSEKRKRQIVNNLDTFSG